MAAVAVVTVDAPAAEQRAVNDAKLAAKDALIADLQQRRILLCERAHGNLVRVLADTRGVPHALQLLRCMNSVS